MSKLKDSILGIIRGRANKAALAPNDSKLEIELRDIAEQVEKEFAKYTVVEPSKHPLRP